MSAICYLCDSENREKKINRFLHTQTKEDGQVKYSFYRNGASDDGCVSNESESIWATIITNSERNKVVNFRDQFDQKYYSLSGHLLH